MKLCILLHVFGRRLSYKECIAGNEMHLYTSTNSDSIQNSILK